MNDIQVLERAVAVAENMEPSIGYDVLLAAAKRYIRSQRVYPVGGSVSSNRCPSCGQYNAGAHYCTGRPSVGGIEYWRNQPTSGGIGSSIGVAINGTEAKKGEGETNSQVMGHGGQGSVNPYPTFTRGIS